MLVQIKIGDCVLYDLRGIAFDKKYKTIWKRNLIFAVIVGVCLRERM